MTSGFLGMALFRKDLLETFPTSDTERRRMKAAEKCRADNKIERRNKIEARQKDRKLKRLQNVLDSRQRKLDETYDMRRAEYESRLDKYLLDENHSEEITKNAKAMAMKNQNDVLKYGQGLTVNHMVSVFLAIKVPIDPMQTVLSWQSQSARRCRLASCRGSTL